MIYADYSYYTGTYYGNMIPEADFMRCAARASDYIDRLTLDRASAYVEAHPEDEKVKKACCAAAEQYYMIGIARENAAADGGEIASESVGSHSVTYRSAAESEANLEAVLHKAVTSYLATTGLLYRGCKNVHASYGYIDRS